MEKERIDIIETPLKTVGQATEIVGAVLTPIAGRIAETGKKAIVMEYHKRRRKLTK